MHLDASFTFIHTLTLKQLHTHIHAHRMTHNMLIDSYCHALMSFVSIYPIALYPATLYPTPPHPIPCSSAPCALLLHPYSTICTCLWSVWVTWNTVRRKMLNNIMWCIHCLFVYLCIPVSVYSWYTVTVSTLVSRYDSIHTQSTVICALNVMINIVNTKQCLYQRDWCTYQKQLAVCSIYCGADIL